MQGFLTLFQKELLRFAKVSVQTVAAPVLTYLLRMYSETLLFGYKMGFEVLLVVAGLTMVGLRLIGRRRVDQALVEEVA